MEGWRLERHRIFLSAFDDGDGDGDDDEDNEAGGGARNRHRQLVVGDGNFVMPESIDDCNCGMLLVIPTPSPSRMVRLKAREAVTALTAFERCYPGMMKHRVADKFIAAAEEKAEELGEEFSMDAALKKAYCALRAQEDSEGIAELIGQKSCYSWNNLIASFNFDERAKDTLRKHPWFCSAQGYIVHRYMVTPNERQRIVFAYSLERLNWNDAIACSQLQNDGESNGMQHAEALVAPTSSRANAMRRKRDLKIFSLGAKRLSLIHAAGKCPQESADDIRRRHASGTINITVPATVSSSDALKVLERAIAAGNNNDNSNGKVVLVVPPALQRAATLRMRRIVGEYDQDKDIVLALL